MKKIGARAVLVVFLAAAVLMGTIAYVISYADHGKDWAMFYSADNAGSEGSLTDRNGVTLASFDAAGKYYAADELTRRACYHVTGDYWNRTGTGLISRFWSDMHSYDYLTGTTRAERIDLRLTIDSELNRVAYQALEGRKGAVMMMNYLTGEVPVMVSTPEVDPLVADAEPADGAYLNRCLAATFTPGSVFKLITAAAAIENIPDIYEKTFTCLGEYDIAGVTITCAGTHYDQTFEQALANSCNCAFAQIAVMLGQDTMMKYVEDYGFTDNHDLNGITTAAGKYLTEFAGDPELAWSGIGQSVDLVSPYAMLRYVAAVANGGVLIEPSVVFSDDAPKTTRILDELTANKLSGMMNYNVTAHYEPDVNFPGLRLCAKTGTAEVGGDKLPHAWFAGFLLDAEHPYAFVVIVENGGYGLSAAGGVANALLQAAVSK